MTGTTARVTHDISAAVAPDAVRVAVDRVARRVPRWHEPRLAPSGSGATSATFTLARRLEWPTRVRVEWHRRQEHTRVSVSVRPSEGLPGRSLRVLDRFVDELATEIGGDVVSRSTPTSAAG